MIRAILLVLLFCNSVVSFAPAIQSIPTSSSQLGLFNFGQTSAGGNAKIPTSSTDRDKQAISSVKAAIEKPRNPSFPFVECEFPALEALNKLGDGSLRSTLQAEEANIAFISKLVKGLAPAPFMGPKVSVAVSSSASNSFLTNMKKKVSGASVFSLKDGIPELSVEDVCVVVTPSSRNDYQAAKVLVESGSVKAVVVVNAFAKDQKSIPAMATMAYFLKPLTYNSQVAGFLIRSYPGNWTVLDAFSKEVLGSFTDNEILVKKTNTPDLRSSGRLVQKSVDERAIRARQ
uniref:DUF1995 domain-containing protein n=1 Tax=Chaetoceros debilis TaxID=122233 RepID=A0A7S3V4D8_9STRA|mmetsp:Transcript_21982/g.33419  ORF Transcript_21982/g.33419 Transcript_21982/m.33419 type:complete len:288 (+) Transcript_21982:37-900(+)